MPPIIWQSNCIESTAFYEWNNKNKTLYITNTCYLANGKKYENKGRGKLIPGSDADFLVKFDINDIRSEYWVLSTDYDNYSIVSGPQYQHVWVLFRYKNSIKTTKESDK